MSESTQLLSVDGQVPTFLILPPGILAEGVHTLLDSDDRVDVVGSAHSWETAKPRIAATRPEVVVLDADLPSGETTLCCQELVRSHPELSTLLLADQHNPQQMLDALNMGVSGYVLKSISVAELAASIAHLAAGGSLVSPKAIGTLLESLRVPQTVSPLSGLTQLEIDVLRALTSGATNRQIGRQLHLSEKTVKNYVSSILNKLNLRNRTEAAVLASRLEPALTIPAQL